MFNMKENVLINLLIIVGILSFLAIIIAGYFSNKSLYKILPEIITTMLCLQDENNTFAVSEPSLHKCQYIGQLSELNKNELCFYYSNEKIEACRNLKETIDIQFNNCLNIMNGKEPNQTVSSSEIKKNCDILRS